MAAVETTGPRTYGNWRRPASAGIMGLGWVGTLILMTGLGLTIIVVMFGGVVRGLVVFAVLFGFLFAVLRRDRHGRSAVWRGLVRVTWWRAKASGSNLYRSGPLGRTVWGTYQLPGLAAALQLSEHTDGLGRRFGLLWCPATATYTTVIECGPDGASLVDEDQIDTWVADWGQWLARLGDEPNVEAATVTLETVPDTGWRLRREIDEHVDPQAPEFSRAVLDEIRDSYPAGASGIHAWAALTFSATSHGGGRRKAEQAGQDLASRLPGLTRSLESTGAGSAAPVSAQDLCEIVREAYDPAVGPVIEASSDDADLDWANVGPAAAEATWDAYRHDSAWSASWAMSTAPRGNVQSSVLYRLLSPHPDVARKRVTLVYRPIDAARAAEIVESDLNAARFRLTSSDRPTAREAMSTRAAQATASEEASGAGLENFGLLVSATVADKDDLPAARAAIENMAGASRLRLRPCYGSQDSAFAASLPLGLVLPLHLRGVETMKDEL
ncbi:Putative integral membrane protein [Acidipropionibacterium acidipropionici ATCC 4875]|uniref:Integral membrane protein n=1 Tax=Acidipropionibacterium acidipropionici (strain ATCC 4875 / DSM 20272 / JCM 6432 / NBRC 12425 / NCIMB 8070 / 4) TaxID=1171373 RepID=K7SJ43_ACIA4|nr:SCO6880 family protein [Acidipropionibacterium acidipropionici]AFV89285.1 Putative integral membrane protein [Acidipropionibacterium acidipropionici ATCC 4875]